MAGMSLGGPHGRLPVINLFYRRTAGNPIILDAGEASLAGRRQVRLHVIEVQIEPDVAVEIAITWVPGVAGVPAPDLPRAIRIASKSGDAIGREDRRKRSVSRPWPRVQNAVSRSEERR